MHVRRRVPLLKIVSLDTMLSKLRVAKPQLFFFQVTHLLTPIAVRRSAADDELHLFMEYKLDGTLTPTTDLM